MIAMMTISILSMSPWWPPTSSLPSKMINNNKRIIINNSEKREDIRRVPFTFSQDDQRKEKKDNKVSHPPSKRQITMKDAG